MKKKPAAKTKIRVRTTRTANKKAASTASKSKKPDLKRRKAAPKPPLVKTQRVRKAESPAEGIPEKQRNAALKILDERKAEDVVTVDVRGRSALADYVIIATGRSNRQLAAMAAYLEEGLKTTGARRIRIEGLPQGDWVLLDTGDVLVHLFRPDVRRYYNIEDLWTNPRRL